MIKKLQDFARKDDAVIEVFSEILLTGIIVIAIAAAAAFVLSSLDGPDNVRVDIDHWADEDTNTLYFRHSGGETVNVDDLELVVYVNGSYETLNSSQFNYSSNEWALGDVIEVNTSSQLNYDIDEDNVPSKLVHTASSLVIYDAYGSIGDSGADDGGNGGDDGGGDPLPDGDVAYDDANGNGQYDNGETTYEEDDLISFSNTSVDLVIETEYINQEGTDINIEANSIKLGANITTDKKIDLKSEEDLYIVGATIDAKEDIKIDAKQVYLTLRMPI
ncbi:type IV pilin N-terminal domain-containing protein [Methanohalophilus profundi]|uniref:type IV pilin N-terminal domain-containing protein n=1 Tax=Methanohalophilus profundi TaxID=2138083 RepID=UPI00101E0FC2|nr:type IV pilin N-terminal domain-containing protein [Methanohalophilus profundi]